MASGERLHIAIVYRSDDTIRIYRNGQPYGKAYKPQVDLPVGRLQTYLRDDAIIELSTSKDLELEEARVYSSALSSDQIAQSYREGVSLVTLEDLTRVMTPDQRLVRTNLVRELETSKAEYAAIRKPDKVFAIDSRPPEPTHVLIRGNVNDKGERVTPGAVSCFKGLSGELGLEFDASDARRRIALANWIASPNNPLFARVMVNRVWHYHFGAGLVRNPNDFGFNGGTPSHPELLDWLAREFINSGWSLKKLHKLIVTSQTYRQSSRYETKASEKDAENRLLSRYSSPRLPAEAVRDAMLAVSGKLNATMYGPSFRPFTIVRNSGSYHSYEPVDSDATEQQRRTVYRMNVNSGGNPMLDALDCPVPSVKTPQRSTTTTPLQVVEPDEQCVCAASGKGAGRSFDKGGCGFIFPRAACVRACFRTSRRARSELGRPSPWLSSTVSRLFAGRCSMPVSSRMSTDSSSTRRRMLFDTGAGFGWLACRGSLADRRCLRGGGQPHFPPKVKRVVQVFCVGGMSHLDTFDYKPELSQRNGQPFNMPTFFGQAGNLLGSVFPFQQRGQSGVWVSDLLPNLAQCADKLTVIRTMVAKSANHMPAVAQMNTGFILTGFPSMGAWVVYALGSENRESAVVRCAARSASSSVGRHAAVVERLSARRRPGHRFPRRGRSGARPLESA